MKHSTFLTLILGLMLTAALLIHPPALSAQMVSSFWKMNHDAVDAEYSRQLDKIITVSTTPSGALHIVDPVAGTDVAVSLGPFGILPMAVSVGPDGTHAMVGSGPFVVYVDLVSQTVLYWVDMATQVLDVVLAGNGYAYIFASSDPYIRCLNLETRTYTLHTGSSVSTMKATLHPNGTRIYGLNSGFSPATIDKYDISGGTASYLYSSPYQGQYLAWGDLWISEDGQSIYDTNGGIFSSSDNQSQDILYKGVLTVSDIGLIAHLSHSSAVRKLAAVPDNYTLHLPTALWIIRDTEAQIYDYDSLNLQARLVFPAFPVDDKSFTSHGRFVFFNADGSKLFAIVRADSKSGLTVNNAIVTYPLTATGRIVYGITASAGPHGTISPEGTVEVLGGDSLTFTITPAQGYQVLDVLVDGVSVGAVTSYEFKSVLSNHTIAARFWIPGDASDFFPLTPGSVWTYQKNGTQSETLTVLRSTTQVKKAQAHIIQYSSDKSQDYYTSDDDGIRLQGGFVPSMYIEGYGHFAVRETMDPPVKMAQGTPSLGQAFHSAGTVRAQVLGIGTAETTYTSDFTVSAYESVTVPAGTFDALKLSYTLTVGGETKAGDLYLARGVGEIKHAYTVSGQSTVYELASTNTGMPDLAITNISAPASLAFTKKVTQKASTVKVVIQNRGLVPETIRDLPALSNLVTLSVESLGACPNPVAVISPAAQKKFPVTLQSKDSLVVTYNVTFDCVNDPARSTPKDPHHYDYRFSAAVERSVIDGITDAHPADDVCPRTVSPPYAVDPFPDGSIRDKGCGARRPDGTFGNDILLDIVGP